jgi:hypothetical protein
LQMFYSPSRSSKDTDFQDYGCYFLKKRSRGAEYEGRSTGFGPSDKTGKDELSVDHHEMIKRK